MNTRTIRIPNTKIKMYKFIYIDENEKEITLQLPGQSLGDLVKNFMLFLQSTTYHRDSILDVMADILEKEEIETIIGRRDSLQDLSDEELEERIKRQLDDAGNPHIYSSDLSKK